jgi:hypothetical protein
MTYGLSTRLFIEDGPTARREMVAAGRTVARSWRILDAERRLAVVERALTPANDSIEGFPAAL